MDFNANAKPPILVTGSHRSGTTWVGKMLAQSPGVGYIGEPFSLARRPGICSAVFPFWYTYVAAESDAPFLEPMRRTLSFKYDFSGVFRARPSPRRLVRCMQDAAHFTSCRIRGCRPLMKDPLAFFSADWLASTFGMSVVVMVRHPAAFVASLKVKDWTFPIDHLASQPDLIARYLPEFEDEIERLASQETDLVTQAVLLWRAVHATIGKYQVLHPEWTFVRLEDLARAPVDGLREIHEAIALPFTERSERAILHSSQGPAVGAHAAAFGTVRDSKASLLTWKTRLTEAEILRVRRGVEDVAIRFYRDDEW